MRSRRNQAERMKRILEKAGDLTSRQIDMTVIAALSLPAAVMDEIIVQIEKDPKSILKDIKIPGRR